MIKLHCDICGKVIDSKYARVEATFTEKSLDGSANTNLLKDESADVCIDCICKVRNFLNAGKTVYEAEKEARARLGEVSVAYFGNAEHAAD